MDEHREMEEMPCEPPRPYQYGDDPREVVQHLMADLTQAREELELYRLRLAGALIASEGGNGRPDGAIEAIRTCPTIASVMALRAACEVLGAEVARVHGIAQTHLHPDRSISLEAQGYDQIDCAVIGAVDSMAAKILNPNPPLGIESPIKKLLADPIAAKYIKEASNG